MERSLENKKVRNTHPEEYLGINFKSTLEKNIYVALKDEGFPVEYEGRKFILVNGFQPKVPFYNKNRATRMLKLETKKILPITYTPDFIFTYKGHLIVIEGKGRENDVFPLKKKLFRKWLEENEPKSLYFEVYSKKQVLQAIEIIKNLKET